MYELWIENKNGIYQVADLGETIPLMNYGAADIGDLAMRQANFSLTIALPFSDNNVKLFEHSDQLDVVTHFAYTKHNCRLYCNGRIIAGIGSYIRLLEVTDVFTCQIRSGITDLFERMQEVDLGYVDLGTIQWHSSAVAKTDARADMNIYGISEFAENAQMLTIDDNNRMFAKYAMPFCKVHSAVRLMLDEYFGYELLTDAPKRREVEMLRIGTHQMYADSFKPLNGNGEVQTETIHFVDRGDSAYVKLQNPAVFVNNKGRELELTAHNDITFMGYTKINVTYTANTNLKVYINNVIAINFLLEFPVGNTSATQGAHINFIGAYGDSDSEKKMKAGEKISIKIKLENIGDKTNTISYTTETIIEEMRYTDEQDQSVPFGGLIPVSKNLGFNTAFDLMKFYIQLYGLIVYVDEPNKKVYAYTLSEVYKNRQHGLDWTDKVDRRDRTFSFTIGSYARTNYLALKEDAQGNQAKGMFKVNDETLKKEATLFTLPTNTALDILRGTRRVVNIPDVEIAENGGDKSYKIKTDKPYCVSCEEEDTANITVFYDSSNDTLRTAHLPYVQGLNMQDIVDTYYMDLSSQMLSRPRMIEVSLMLDDEDIERYAGIDSKTDIPG